MTGISANNVHGQILSMLEHAGTYRKNGGTCPNMPENGNYLVKYQNTGTCRKTLEKLNKKNLKFDEKIELMVTWRSRFYHVPRYLSEK